MEGEGDLMKMLMQADPPDENIQGAMEDPGMVQSGGYAQAGMAFHSGHYGGMQQQLNPMGAQQQQQRGSSYHSMGTGQMMAQDMDMVLQQQQYQQPQQQSAYGNGNFQGYNGGYQGPSPVSPQTHNQPMVPYQGGFPSEHGYSQGAAANQAMGEYGPQAGPNQNIGITGPASLSLANLSAMSGRQQYYPDGYGMNQPVSPVRKQMQQGGGFLQPSRVPYPQQAQPYPSGSYPKRPSSSPVQNQMQGFPSAGSFTPRPNPGMQIPSIPYQSPTSQYQPPHSPVMRSATSPIPQQDAVLYSRPREPFPQPQSPFGPSQGQLQQQQPQSHSSCMFVQPGTMPPQAQYQPQQQMAGAKSAALAQRRASYPGQQSPMKMPSSVLKRSPTSPLSNSKSPDLTRSSQGGFDERASFKVASKKEKASSPSSADLAQVAVSSKMREAVPKNAEGRKGLSRTRRSASDVGSPSVSPPVVKKDVADGVGVPKDADVGGNIQEPVKKHENVDTKEDEPKKSDETTPGEMSKRSPKSQGGDKNKSPQGCSNNKADRSCSPVTEDLATVVERTEPEKESHLRKQTPTKVQQMVAATEEGCKEGEDSSNGGEKSASKIESSIAMSRETKNAAPESVELDQRDGLPGNVNDKPDLRTRKDKELSGSESVNGKDPQLTDKTEQENANNHVENTCPEKADERSGKTVDGTEQSFVESDKVGDKTGEPVPEADKTVDEADIPSQDTISGSGNTGVLIDGAGAECVVTDNGDEQPGEAGQRAQSGQSDNAGVKADLGMADKTLDSVSNGSKDKEKSKDDDDADKAQTEAEKSDGQSKELSELDRTAEPSSRNLGANRLESKVESKQKPAEVAGDKIGSKTSDSDSVQTTKVQKKPAVVSLRCEERLSSDDDDRPAVPVESSLAPTAVSRTQGIQTSEETTASPRSSQQQATSIKATIIAKGKSPQNNQQVMVAKTTTGQMYLIQGNILVPVQSLNTKCDSASKQNSKVIIVNPVKTTSGSVGRSKTPVAAAKSSHSKEKNETNTSNNTDKEKPSEESKPVAGNKKSVESVSESLTSPNNKRNTESTDKAPATTGSTIQPSQSVQTSALEKKKTTSKTECRTEKDMRNSPDKQPKTPSPKKNTTTTEESPTSTARFTGRGRPPGSKDKQKRKAFVHKSKRKQDDLDVGPNKEEPSAKRKFSKTASVVIEMSSSLVERSAASKRPLGSDVPTVNASKSPKRRKVSISSSPVKHISTKPRGGVDGDSWVCSLCGKRSGCNFLGDLYGPYKTRLAKEKTDNSTNKDGKPSQKLSSPGRVSSSSSDTPADRKSSSGFDTREEGETCDLDLWIHRGCGVWSPGVFMLGRTIHGLEQAVESAAQHNCTKCSEVGATLACFKRGCNKMFHFACARDSGCSFIEDNFTIFCSTHKC